MKLTKKWLNNHHACSSAIEWFAKQKTEDHKKLFRALIKDKSVNLEWGDWYLSRRLPKIKRAEYAVYAAKQVIKIYESRFPENNAPREAIKAAENYVKNPTPQARAHAAAYAAADAADAAYDAVDAAAHAAAYAAHAAAYAAEAAAHAAAYDAAYAAEAAAEAAARAAVDAAEAAVDATYAKRKMQIKILKYGLRLLLEKQR